MARRSMFNWEAYNLGQRLKREALDRVLGNAGSWTPKAQKSVLRLCELMAGAEMLGEDISAIVLAEHGAPHHHNALGSLGNWYVMKGLVIEVDRLPMRKPRSHARKSPLYKLVHPRDAVPVPRHRKKADDGGALVWP